MGRVWMYLFSAVGVLVTPGAYRSAAMEVTTPKEVTAVNGTSVLLKCTFKSTHPINDILLSVNWRFRPLGQTTEESVFYYQKNPYPLPSGRFKGHVTWSGNVLKNDASITLQDVQFGFNGTYSCFVANPPDVHSLTSEINLQVVQSVKLSEIGILAAAVGGAILLVLLILSIFLTVRYCQRKREDTGVELENTEFKQESIY
ncbi:myelin protein zero-like protein 2b [Pygocentrus nattereri]|uniref:myelin protein zero-like protein 2b n=1 Tax=Pygocentrus nattereri TaxID=42514 RepID=UPI0008146726|nr:myelin protein zero-like protein 2b [Pygocentrus nattereri]